MAPDRGPADRPLADVLFEEAHRFDFYQAVRLLETLYPRRVPPGEDVEPLKETVRFASTVGIDFPASDVAEAARPGRPTQPASMRVNFLGLAGALGPLPPPYTELILERTARKDTAFRDFLDIFNHRLVSFMYRARKKHRVPLDPKSPDQARVAQYLYALIGLGTGGLRGRMSVRDRSLLAYAGLLAQQPRSMAGLEVMLAHYFRVPVRGVQMRGAWHRLDESQTTAIGLRGRNQRLGATAVLGTRVWDQQAGIRLRLGPLSFAEFTDFLPTGRAWRPLCGLTRFWCGRELDFDVQLTLRAAQVPPARLGATDGPRLGWTSWLKTREFTHDDSQVILRGAA
jgi:type VI secretion system protein ImpH